MTNPTPTVTAVPAGHEIVLFAKVGSQRFTLTANQLRDTVAAYLARGAHMPTPTDINGGDPNAPLRIIVEEWLWGNVPGWLDCADVVHLVRQPQCVISVGVSDHGVGHRVINFRCDVPERQRDGRAAVDS